MTDTVKDSIKSAGVQAIVGLAAFAAMWFLTVRDDLADHGRRITNNEKDLVVLQAHHEEDEAVAIRLKRLEDAVGLIGAHLKIPGFPNLGGTQ